MGTAEYEVQELVERARETIRMVRSCLSPVDSKYIQEELAKVVQELLDPAGGDEARIKGKLHHLAQQLNRLRELAERGLDAIPEHFSRGTTPVALRMEVQSLLTKLQTHGLFLVPVGELESWLSILMKGQSREDKKAN